MDYGLMIILIIFIIYYAFQYKKTKKAMNLLMIFFFVGSALYKTKYPIYDQLQEFQQKILNISYVVFALILLFTAYINKTKKKKTN